MSRKLLLLVVTLLVALPTSFSVFAQDDLGETLELDDFGFTMSYPDGWTATDYSEDSPFVVLAEDEDDLGAAGDASGVNGQLVIILPFPEDSVEDLGQEVEDRLGYWSETFAGSLRARDVDQLDISGGYDTSIGITDVDGAALILAEVLGGEGFAFYIFGMAPEDAAEDLEANFTAMLDTIEIGASSGGDDDDDGGDADTGDAESIEYGDTVEGEISDDEPVILYTFEGSEGDVVTITMIDTSRSGELDPYIQLVNEDGDVLTDNDDHDDADLPDNFDSQITEFELEDDGTYIIVASRFGQENGSSEGEYELTLDDGGNSGGNDDDDDDGGDGGDGGDIEIIDIEYGDSVEGEISDDEEFVVYAFEASEGDVVTITMIDTSRSGDLDPYLQLADSEGEVIADNDDHDDADLDDSLDSQITEFEIEEDGTYFIVATRFSGEGEFELTLEGDN
jgi:hypothetical protein